ncbi:MAG: ABC transporter permease [Planctomycetes bacterium]|nr:ABC transporter permease [Planctomycetota bacterium]
MMRLGTLLMRSIGYYRRTHAALICTAMVCTAVLTGALLVGDSVRAGLRYLAEVRLGRVRYSLIAHEYPFRSDLARHIANRTGFETAAILMTDAAVEKPDGSVRINRVHILGVEEDFFAFGASKPAEHIWLPAVNEALRQQLGEPPFELIVRLDNPSALPRDLIFASDEHARALLRIRANDVVPDAAMGRFQLQANQQPPLNLFVPRAWLATQLDLGQRANVLVVAPPPGCPSSTTQLDCALANLAEPEDLGLDFVEYPDRNTIELNSKRLFIPDAVSQTAVRCGQKPLGIFTYFVNSISHGIATTPYSMVAGLGNQGDIGMFESLADNEIIINEWLAEDLKADTGDTLKIDYFAITPVNTLKEEGRTFLVRQVVPMLGFAADPTLMPPFPGLAETQNCQDWDPAIPIDLSRIRDKDEAYWDQCRGTPKAFISLRTAQMLWQNRFGNLTAIRWPMAENTTDALRKEVADKLNPATLGLFFVDAAEHNSRASGGSADFGGLFTGLSMFLILACVVIVALIFVFMLQQRSSQAGILLAMGWTKGKVAALLLGEGTLLALIGAVGGMLAGMAYTLGMMAALRTVWQDAVAGAMLRFYANPVTLVIGTAAGFLIAVGAMGIGLLGCLKKTPIDLLSYTPTLISGRFSTAGRVFRLIVLALLAAGLAGSFLLLNSLLSEDLFFFLSGTLLLLISVLAAVEIMRAAALIRKVPSSPSRLIVKNITRRPGRSLAVMLTVACGVFMVLGVGLNHRSPAHYTERDSGTGGFALWVETALPMAKVPDESFIRQIAQQTNSAEAITLVALRQHRGDDASCLNLNRAQNPTILGVKPEEFARRGAFTFRTAEPTQNSPWTVLTRPIDNDTIPAIGDYATVYWGLGLSLGDTLSISDDRGREFKLKIVGILKDSIFQGRLLINERDFIERFPSKSGYNVLLVDADFKQADALSKILSQDLAEYGAEVLTTQAILRDFLRVENTYLTIFLALGGLGLILGSAGAGLVLLFNVMDRRGELAMMQAMGFSKISLRRLLLAEHISLFGGGVVIGGVSAVIAVLPAIKATSGGTLMMGLLLTALVLFSGVLWVSWAAKAALRRRLIDNLRNE